MTVDLVKSIETRDKMHLALTQNAENRDLIEKYKTYRNKLNKLIIKQNKKLIFSEPNPK